MWVWGSKVRAMAHSVAHLMVMALQFVLKLEREERKHEEIRIAGNSSEEYTSIVE